MHHRTDILIFPSPDKSGCPIQMIPVQSSPAGPCEPAPYWSVPAGFLAPVWLQYQTRGLPDYTVQASWEWSLCCRALRKSPGQCRQPEQRVDSIDVFPRLVMDEAWLYQILGLLESVLMTEFMIWIASSNLPCPVSSIALSQSIRTSGIRFHIAVGDNEPYRKKSSGSRSFSDCWCAR